LVRSPLARGQHGPDHADDPIRVAEDVFPTEPQHDVSRSDEVVVPTAVPDQGSALPMPIKAVGLEEHTSSEITEVDSCDEALALSDLTLGLEAGDPCRKE
jgi:hypothetical protein